MKGVFSKTQYSNFTLKLRSWLTWSSDGSTPPNLAPTWTFVSCVPELSHRVSWHERGLCHQFAVPTSEPYRRTLEGNIYIQWHLFFWCATTVSISSPLSTGTIAAFPYISFWGWDMCARSFWQNLGIGLASAKRQWITACLPTRTVYLWNQFPETEREIFHIPTAHTNNHLTGSCLVGVLSFVFVTRTLSVHCALLIHVCVISV